MTNLEAISEKLQESNKVTLENILKVSGSSAITKNEFGVTVVEETNPASSLIFKILSKPKYDETELVKAIDVEVVELKPNIPKPNLDLVPKPLYDEQIALVEDLRLQVERLNATIDELRVQITTLEAQVQTEINNRLSIEQTNDVLVNQIDTMTNTINDFSNQIATSLQKSVDESILRASLQSQKTGFKAQIEALIQQINSLNAIIEGLQAQLGAVRQQKDLETTTKAQGGVIVNKIVSANFTPAGTANEPVMHFKIKNARDDAKEWIRGKKVTLVNNDLEPVNVTLSPTWNNNQRWFRIPKASFSISPGATEEIEFVATPENVSYGKRDHTTDYNAGLTISINRADGTSETKSFSTRLTIAHPKSYDDIK